MYEKALLTIKIYINIHINNPFIVELRTFISSMLTFDLTTFHSIPYLYTNKFPKAILLCGNKYINPYLTVNK